MKKKDLGLLALAIAAGALVVGFSLWWHYKEDPEELIRIKNVAVGYLENAKEDEYQLAAPLFEKLVQALPEDPLGYRNLTIALFAPNDLTNRWMTKSVFGAGGPARLLASVEGMLRVEGRESAAAYYLAGRVFREYADEVRWEGPALDEALAKARRYFREAARLSPRDPAPYYQLSYLESEFVAPDRPSNEAFEALQAAVRLAPDNLWLRADWLSLLAGREDPELRDAVAQTQRILPPDCNPGVPKYLGEAAALLAQNDPTARRQSAPSATSAANLLRSHPKAKQDQKQVNPFTSAFVLTDFGSSFSSRLPPEIVEPPIPVKFVAVPHGDAAPATSIVALSRVELTSQPIEELGSCVSRNHEFGTVVLRPGKERSQVQVLAAQGKGAFPPIEVAGTFTNFALVDLDWDLFYAKLRPTDKDAAKVPADLDLVLYGPSGVRIFENREENRARHWVDRTDDAKIPKLSGVQWLLAQDIDHDGNIDLVVGLEKGVRVLRNLGEMEFAEITGRSAGLSELQTIAAAAADFDRDGDLDIMCLTKTGTLVLLENERGGRFAAKEQPGDFAKATTLIAFDANNDGRVDLLIGHGSGATLLLAHETQTLPIAAKRMELATNSAVRQMGFFDYDNDGWMDLWLLTDDANKPLRLFRNVNGTRFEDTTNLLPELFGPITAVCVSDFDDDGDLDLLLAGANGVIGLRNDGGNQNNWLDLRVRAIENKGESGTGQAAKVNYFNTGGTIEIRSGRHYQWQQVADTVTHFGLGKRRQLDAARIIWTNGVPQAVIRPHINQAVAAEQAPKGSCPFLFAWNGERFVMVTDCLWSSALGMKLAPDVYMDHHRQENHLIITDDQLRPRNGEYVLQFTNELWEVPYLDQAELWVIEHPADVEVFTNQRIGPPLDGGFRFRTVHERRLPVAARDHHGRDVLGELNQRDKRYVGGFQRRRYVGFTEPHWLELDLGDLGQAKRATMYLSGWIWPTDTSANVAIAQNPHLVPRASGEGGKSARPTLGGADPPELLIPDGRGGWATAIPNMGFPCGKMQTVAVDLPLTQFPKGDYCVRIATAMELYWSEAFITVDEAEVPVAVTKLPIAKADLHYRGFSQKYQNSPSSPFLFNYEIVDRTPAWLPIPGPYTRCGDVTELLAKPDDRYVVMSIGDELTLRFPAPPPPRLGRKYTYLFYANGWLKDFDMNGGASDHVGPLPFETMRRYPYAQPEVYPQTAEKQEFLREYMTREPDARKFWDLLRPTDRRRQDQG